MRKITLTGGPLDGKRYVVPESADRFTPHHGRGHYVIEDGVGTWRSLTETVDATAQTLAEFADALDSERTPGKITEATGHAETILAEARLGNRVLVAATSRAHARETFDAIVDTAAHEGARIRRTSGDERFDYPGGGTVRFVSANARKRARGIVADVLFIRTGVAEAAVTELLPTLAAGRAPLIIREEEAA